MAGLHEPNWDRLCRSLDWNESNLGEVAATLEEVELGADPISILVADEMNRIPESRNPTPCIVVIVPGSSAITYRTHFKHNITVILIKRSTTGLIIT
jgi:hypothetical protein